MAGDFDVFGFCDAGIFKENIDTGKFSGASGKCFDGVVGGEVEGPDFDDGGVALGGVFDVSFGCFSGLGVADGEDQFRGFEARKMACGFLSEACVGTGDDDGLAGEGGCRIDWLEPELGPEEALGYEAHRGGGVLWESVCRAWMECIVKMSRNYER